MKAVVLQIQNGKTAVLTKNGVVRVVKDRGYTVGEEIVISRENNVITPAFRMICAAAAVVLCFISGYLYLTPYSYVSVDINPSIEYTLNRFDRVLSVRSLNDDGAKIADEIDIIEVFNKPVQKAVELTVKKLSESEYVDEQQDNIVLVAAASRDEEKSHRIAQSIENSDFIREIDNAPNGNLTVNSISVSENRMTQAHKMGVSAGKLELVETLAREIDSSQNKADKEQNESFSKEEWLKKPVREVVKEIDRRRDEKVKPVKHENSDKQNNGKAPSDNLNRGHSKKETQEAAPPQDNESAGSFNNEIKDLPRPNINEAGKDDEKAKGNSRFEKDNEPDGDKSQVKEKPHDDKNGNNSRSDNAEKMKEVKPNNGRKQK